MLHRSKFLIIPNSQGQRLLISWCHWYVAHLMSLIDCSLESFRRLISRYAHPFRYIYPVPFFHLLRPSISIYLYSVHTHTHAYKCTHACACVDTYTCTPRQMIRVITSQRDPILPAVHTYMNTRIHTHHTCLHVWCSGIWRREQKTEGEETRDRERRWLINDNIYMYSILPASVSPPLLSSEPKSRLPQWGAPKPSPTAYCCIRAH